jgi:hypothetical protein
MKATLKVRIFSKTLRALAGESFEVVKLTKKTAVVDFFGKNATVSLSQVEITN